MSIKSLTLLKVLITLTLLSLINPMSQAQTKVTFETDLGPLVIELEDEMAPKTVENFIAYVNDGFYDKTIFHRIIRGFVVQGGGYGEVGKRKETKAPIENEADNGLKNVKYSLSMARTSDPHSASSQFFINLNDNTNLDHTGKGNSQQWGYAVFGRVVEGQELVSKMALIPTGKRGQDVPDLDIFIQKAFVNQ